MTTKQVIRPKNLLLLVLLFSAGLLASTASAAEWTLIGSRYLGMGGAGVASVNDSFASYWNPAALAVSKSYDAQINMDLGASLEGEALETFDDIEDLSEDVDDLLDGATVSPGDIDDLEDLRDTLLGLGENGTGLVGNVSAGLNLRWQRYAVFSRVDGRFALSPVTDRDNVEIPSAGQDFDDIANGLDENDSGARVRGLAVSETGVGYGHSFEVPFAEMVGLEKLGTFSVGGNLKYMRGMAFSKYVNFREIEDADLDFGDSDLRKESDNFGLDLGFLYEPIEMVRVGMVARNVNSPKFDTGRDRVDPNRRGSFKLDAQVRGGVAVYPFESKWLVIASDLDLTKNESDLLDGFESRMWSIGAEANLPISVVRLALRGGGYLNTVSDADQSFVFTFGAGLKVWLMSLDLAGGISANRVDVGGGDKYPSRFNGSAILAVRGNF